MILNKKNNIVYFTYNNFIKYPNIINVVSSRMGGISKGIFKSLNLSFYVGDKESNVIFNRQKLCDSIRIDINSLVTCNQVHGSNIAIVDSTQKGRGAFNSDDVIQNTDGLITDSKNLTLFMTAADCAIVSLYDPVKGIIGLAHSGWLGTAKKISQKMIKKMQKIFNCKPEKMLVGISPSIGPCCYKFDKERINNFKNIGSCKVEEIFIKKSDETIHFDLWKAIKIQLIESGILEKNIENPELCTVCNKKYFYSYFSDKGETGRFCGIICLTN